MNVATLEVTPQEAREKLRAYRARRHRDVEAEYAAIAKAYEAVEQGGKLVDVEAAIRAGGFDQRDRPKIALARADRKVVRFRWNAGRHVASFCTHDDWNDDRFPNLVHWINLGRAPIVQAGFRVEAFARVPLVPADVRPAVGQLRDWHVLFEVDQWYDRHPDRPPRDPYLLKHVAGSLYIVLAEWDLTDLEIAVLSAVGRNGR